MEIVRSIKYFKKVKNRPIFERFFVILCEEFFDSDSLLKIHIKITLCPFTTEWTLKNCTLKTNYYIKKNNSSEKEKYYSYKSEISLKKRERDGEILHNESIF